MEISVLRNTAHGNSGPFLEGMIFVSDFMLTKTTPKWIFYRHRNLNYCTI